jgi:hypothetical protein
MLIIAGATHDRYLSAIWKRFFDRSFFNTHTPTLTNKRIGFLISGPLSHMPELRYSLEAWMDWQGAHLIDFVTDESGDNNQISAELSALALKCRLVSKYAYVSPRTFLRIGGVVVEGTPAPFPKTELSVKTSGL